MTETIKTEEKVEPQTESAAIAPTEAIPKEESSIVIPVKFNKEVMELTVDEAAQLAQKGMKYDIIKENYKTLKDLADNEQKTVPEFLGLLAEEIKEKKLASLTEKCNGDKELAEHIFQLENSKVYDNSKGLEEVKKFFPKIKGEEDLPQSVVDSARLKGKELLDEYLRFLLEKKRAEQEALNAQKKAGELSLGSQINRSTGENPETAEFLKGLWR